MTFTERIALPGRKRLLALEGGGIRGVLALEVLQRIEDLLREESGNEEFCLDDYFDYISGTSTRAASLAACLSRGMSVASVLKFHEEAGADMFTKANLLLAYDDMRRATESTRWHTDSLQQRTVEWGIPPPQLLNDAVDLHENSIGNAASTSDRSCT